MITLSTEPAQLFAQPTVTLHLFAPVYNLTPECSCTTIQPPKLTLLCFFHWLLLDACIRFKTPMLEHTKPKTHQCFFTLTILTIPVRCCQKGHLLHAVKLEATPLTCSDTKLCEEASSLASHWSAVLFYFRQEYGIQWWFHFQLWYHSSKKLQTPRTSCLFNIIWE